MNKAFIKVPRKDSEPGKGAFWTIDPTAQDQFIKGMQKKYKSISKRNAGGESESGFSSEEELVAVESDPEEKLLLSDVKPEPKSPKPELPSVTLKIPEPDLQSQLQNTIKQHLLDPIKFPLPASIAQLLPQAIAQLPPQLAGQLSATLQSALKNSLNKKEDEAKPTTTCNTASSSSPP